MVIISKKIGIIGGAGVAATNKLLDIIEIEYTKNGAFRDCHHPEMIIWQAVNAPSRSMYLEGKGESFIPSYIEIAKKLKEAGADIVAMCCNTAHYAIDEIEQKSGIKFINLVKACVLEAKRSKKGNFALIASDGCLQGKIYEKYFNEIFPNAKIIYPDKEYQKLVTKGICNIKNLHRFDEETSNDSPKYIFEQVKEHLKNKGAEKIIMGCTDIRTAYYDENDIDSLEVLKNIIIQEAKL